MRAVPVLLVLLVACGGTVEETDPPDTDTGDGPAEGVDTASTTWDVDMFTLYESPRIARFDTQGGTRRLDAMTIAVDHAIDLDYSLRNGGPMPVEADDYTYDIYFNTLIQLGETPETTGTGVENPPFFGAGTFSTGPMGFALAASDGDDTGGDDQSAGSFSDAFVSELSFDWDETPHFMEAMSGDGEEIIAVVGGFSEEWFNWVEDLGPEALMFAQIDAMRYAGTMTITYEWSRVE